MAHTITKIKPKLIFSKEEIAQAINHMARELEDEFLPDGIVIMPILTSAIPFVSDLMMEIRLPVEIYPCWASTQLDDKTLDEPQVILPDFGKFPDKILILDTLVDSGRTLQTVSNLLLENEVVKEIVIAVLLNKRKVPLDDLFINYSGFHCPSGNVVGYGLDWQGYFRNLENICILKKKGK